MSEIISAQDPRHNELLAALQRSGLERCLPLTREVTLRFGDVLHGPGKTVDFVYFPSTALISLRTVLSDGAVAEVALVGREGLVGIATFLGGGSMKHLAVVQRAGQALRLPAKGISDEIAQSEPARQVLLRYTATLMSQVALTAICIRHHSLEQRLCRWLLSSLDRIGGDELFMTHESIASMLGVRRVSVTQAAAKLQASGLTRYHRGHIHVTDRAGLKARVCECYGVIEQEHQRLFPSRISPEPRQALPPDETASL